MSYTYKVVFDPILGEFKLAKIPVATISGGVTVTSGVLSLPSGSSVECQLEITVTGAGGVTIEPGSTLLVV